MKANKVCKISAILLAIMLAASMLTACGKSEEEGRSKYNIVAVVDTDNMTVSAECDIEYVNRTAVTLDELHFHLYPAAYRDGARFTPVSAGEADAAYPHGVSYGGIEIEDVTGGEYEVAGEDEDILVVRLAKSIMPTESVKIAVSYTLKLPNMRHRLGYCDGVINLGNWFPVECAYDGGFCDTPYYDRGDPFDLPICDYTVSITAPVALTVAMPAPADRNESGETATTVCKLARARDFAAVLGEFESMTDTIGGTAVTYYYKFDEDPAEHLKAACDAIGYFSTQFYAYPYESYTVVQTPFNQGGMEYTGLAYISDAARGQMISEIIIHETAHQWWYGIVGNDQINHAWLDESLAEYSTSLFYGAHPDYGVQYDDRIADAMGGFSLYCELSRCNDTSMERALPDFSTSTEYTYMTYVKGQLMYDSLRKMLGEKTLVAGLRAYANRCAFATATPDDLIASLESTAKRELKSFIQSFLDGSAKLYSHA